MKTLTKYSQKWLKVAVAFALVTTPTLSVTPVFQPKQVQAVAPETQAVPFGQTTPGTAWIEVLVLHDDKKARVLDEELTITIKDKSGTLVDSGTITNGEFVPTSEKRILAKGKYYVTISNGTVSQTTETTVSTRKVALKLVWESTFAGVGRNKSGKILKTGAIGGVVYDSAANTANPVAGETKVTLVSSKTKWETTTKNGIFKIFVPTGTYSVIVEGKDSIGKDDKKNTIYKKVKVSAGQTALPFLQMNSGEAWASDTAKKLDFALDAASFTNISKKYTGKAVPNSIVSVYEVTTTETAQIETWIAETTAKLKKKIDLTGTYSLTVPTAQPGRTLMFKVTDEAGNESTEIQPALAVYDPKLTAATTTPLDKPVVLKFTDKTGVFSKNITKITLTPNDGGEPKTLTLATKTNTAGDYSITTSTITLAAKLFTKEGAYTIDVEAKGFVDQHVKQDIGPSTTPVDPLTATADAGSTTDTTKVIVEEKALATSTDTLVIKVSNSKIPTPTKGTTEATAELKLTTDDTVITDYKSGADITGVSKDYRYIGVYEINPVTKEIVRFKLIVLTVISIKS